MPHHNHAGGQFRAAGRTPAAAALLAYASAGGAEEVSLASGASDRAIKKAA